MEKRELKRNFNKLGLYVLINQLLISGVALAYAFIYMTMVIIKNPYITENEYNSIFDKLFDSGMYMIIAVVIAFIPILILRKKEFFKYDLKVKESSINLKTIFTWIIVMLGVNFLSGYISVLIEYILNFIGYTSMPSMEVLETSTTISMFAYTCVIAPVIEEFIYRGAILRYLENYGAKFAIMASSILFGFMHGNIVQIPATILIGIVFGFVAKKYSIKISILLHMINNIFAEGYNYLINFDGAISNIVIIVDIVIFISFIIIVIKNKKALKGWSRNNRIEKGTLRYFFTSIVIILLLIYNVYTALIGIETI